MAVALHGHVKIGTFPRSADLGLIEARSWLVLYAHAEPFPRSADLGLIEAMIHAKLVRDKIPFPRSADLGLIEAVPSEFRAYGVGVISEIS